MRNWKDEDDDEAGEQEQWIARPENWINVPGIVNGLGKHYPETFARLLRDEANRSIQGFNAGPGGIWEIYIPLLPVVQAARPSHSTWYKGLEDFLTSPLALSRDRR